MVHLANVPKYRTSACGCSFAGEPIEITTTAEVIPLRPKIGMDTAGDFVVTWSTFGPFGIDPNDPIVRSRVTDWGQIFGDGFEAVPVVDRNQQVTGSNPVIGSISS